MKNRLVIGTRSSKLAIIQTKIVASSLQKVYPNLEIEILEIETEGDRKLGTPMEKLSGRAPFTKDIEDKLISGEIDMAVHSLKDLAAELPQGLTIGAILRREDPRDVLVSKNKKLNELPESAKIGTDSLRRTAQILAIRPDLNVLSLRGNVDVRLQKLDQGFFDAIILAAAGLVRLGLKERITQFLPISEMLPAPGQGALACEVAKGNSEILALIKSIDDEGTRAAVSAERAFWYYLGGGHRLPIAAYGEVKNGKLNLAAIIAKIDGRKILRDEIFGKSADWEMLGRELAKRMLESGGREILTAYEKHFNSQQAASG